MTLGKVFSRIQSLYQQALINPTIRKPMAWALYQTWKWVDKQEAEKGEEAVAYVESERGDSK